MATLRSQNKNQIILMAQVWCTHSVTADVRRKSSVHVLDSDVITWVIWQSLPWCMQHRTWQTSRQKKVHVWSHPLGFLPLITGAGLGEGYFLPNTCIILLFWILYSGRSHRYTYVYCYCFILFYIKRYCSILFPRGILCDLIEVFSYSD